ncbi:GAK5 protein, partial [Erpornis zantholeuca]|nr:GAK5 protein [Erpornis zantholeuca]NXS81815.1 GAK5 protein [Erpornis zantholeuca]
MAAAFAAMRGLPATPGVSFSCGKHGHLKRDRATLTGKVWLPVCSQCCRGPHSANQCHSKYDSEGHLLQEYQGNWSQSVGQQRHAMTQMPQPPSQMPAPQMTNRSSPQVFT